MAFTIIHNLDGLDKDAIKKYLDALSVEIGLPAELNGLDTIYMTDPRGGRALVPYARRGTCEVLRELYGVQVDTLTYATVGGSIVFTATGRASAKGNRQEIAVGSKFVEGLKEKVLDNAIMTASTRALQRLTMQFTKYGILGESEVVDLVGQTPNPAGSAQLAEGSTTPPAFLPPPAVPANNAPGRAVTPEEAAKAAPAPPAAQGNPPVDLSGKQPPQYPAAPASASVSVTKHNFPAEKVAKPDIKADTAVPQPPVESTTSEPKEADNKAAEKVAKKSRKKANTVALDVEPEVVHNTAPVKPGLSPEEELALRKPEVAQHSVAQNPPVEGVSSNKVSAPEPAQAAQPPQAPPAQAVAVPAAVGMPTKEQMDEYRKKISVYTVQLPPSQDLGPTQKMRAFITKMSGAAPQNMTTDQWDEVISFFEGFMERNSGNVKNLVKYIDDLLGVK